ncbi:hypothetical protein PQ455_13040 [Sphingomonas naphthae]|uniref:Uncharacterized protein n=1 Tax=Sphingomonas naphthae TaxID=1813468 RepID=A0ABY7TH69_9SPHN|nr:hypothetical protein [Sphingomonas naphthae]WCT72558.1 hypothetical protein PQ455_13040 [Sphingomonas naphthae]
MPPSRRLAAVLPLCLIAAASIAQLPRNGANPVVSPQNSATISYADTADMVLAAPLLAIVTVDQSTALKGPQAAGVAPGLARLFVEATVDTLVRGAGGISPKVSYLVDIPLDTANRTPKPPKLKKQRFLVLARPVAGRPAEIMLVGPKAHIPWTPDAEARVRRVLAETLAPGAAPAITGITSAFHVPGSLPGESETQIFLKTADSRPISLNVLRRPGERPRWAVSLTEMVDNSAAPPPRDTLLWYRLACGLPRLMPQTVVDSLQGADKAAAQADYQLVLAGLGACGRSR